MACERPHERVDLRFAQPGQEVADPARHPPLRPPPLLPAPLVAAKEALIEPSLLEALDESVGGDGGRQQAVEDAPPGRGLGESAGIADDEQALGVRLADVPDGYEPPDRRAGLRDQPLAEVGAGHQPVEAGAVVAQADAAYAGARRDHGAGLAGLRGQAAVERAAIDGEDLFAPASVPDDVGRGATRGPQVSPAHTLEDDVLGELDQFRRLERDD